MSDYAQILTRALLGTIEQRAVNALAIGKKTLGGGRVKSSAALAEMLQYLPADQVKPFCEGIVYEIVNAFAVVEALTAAYEAELALKNEALARTAAIECGFQQLLHNVGVFKLAVGSGGDTEALVKAGRELLAYIQPRMVVSQVPASQVH
jgi:hypothetical protein